MKIKCLFLTALLLASTTIGFAQAKKPAPKPTANTPEQVVKNLYAAAKNEKTNPFDQSSRTLADKYFTKELADLIVKKSTKTDTGWNIDALYDSKDRFLDEAREPQITNFVVGKPVEESGPDDVFLNVNFKVDGKAESVQFNLRREANKTWKIFDIDYSDGDDLSSILEYSTDEEFQKLHDADETFRGDFMVGAMQCNVEKALGSIELYRVRCDGQEGFKLYAVDGDEKQTSYVYTNDKGKEQGKFVFKNGEKDGKYFDASGKEVKVRRVQ